MCPKNPRDVLWSWVTGYNPITVTVTRIPASDGVNSIVEHHLTFIIRGDITTIMNKMLVRTWFVIHVREIKQVIRLVLMTIMSIAGKINPVVVTL